MWTSGAASELDSTANSTKNIFLPLLTLIEDLAKEGHGFLHHLRYPLVLLR